MPVTFDITNDFNDIVDGAGAITVLPDDLLSFTAITTALRRSLNTRELMESNGKYQADDTVFHFQTNGDADGLDIEPGWFISQSGTFYTVLDAHKETLGTRWKLVTRHIDLDFETITVEVNTPTQDRNGAPVASWSTYVVSGGIKGHLQELEGDATMENDTRTARRKGRLYTLIDHKLDSNYRVVDGANYWNVTGFRKPDVLGELPYLELELSDWPSG